MGSFPNRGEILSSHADQVEALERLFRASLVVLHDPASRFHKLTSGEFEERLQQNRDELDLWAVLMLVASFEAAVRHDVADRIGWKSKDAVRKALADLHRKDGNRTLLGDILGVWEKACGISPDVKRRTRLVVKHRHWLAHGRHWPNKYGQLPSPRDVQLILDDYVASMQAAVPDFPRG